MLIDWTLLTSSSMQVARDKLVHLGQCIGKLTHSGKFRLTVGCLDLLSTYAKYKVHVMQIASPVLDCPRMIPSQSST